LLPHEVTHKTLSGHRKAVAVATGVSDSCVEAWCVAPKDQDGNGLASPVERVLVTCLTLRAGGHPEPDALLFYLCGELGYLPPVKAEGAADPTDVRVLASWAKEHSDILSTWARVFQNGALTLSEAEEFRAELRDEIVVCGQWDRGLQRFISSEEAIVVGERRGPRRALPRVVDLRRRA
jgi:hypothetical protein